MSWDPNRIEELAKIIEQYGLTQIEIEEGDSRIIIKKEARYMRDAAFVPAAPPQAAARPVPENRGAARGFQRITEMKALQDELASARESLVQQEKGPAKAARSETNDEAGKNETVVKAPLAGIFYRQPQPGQPPYAEAGSRVKKGDVICLVEAMKMINEVVAERSGVIREFLAENEQFVEYGSPLAVIVEE